MIDLIFNTAIGFYLTFCLFLLGFFAFYNSLSDRNYRIAQGSFIENDFVFKSLKIWLLLTIACSIIGLVQLILLTEVM